MELNKNLRWWDVIMINERKIYTEDVTILIFILYGIYLYYWS